MSEHTVKTEDLQEVQTVGKVIMLSRPIKWEDVEYKELKLDFETLSGQDILDVESDFMDFIRGQKNVFVQFKTEHPGYLAVIAAKAAGVHPNLMKKLSGKDFLKVTGAARDFLSSLV
ncbi:phage tail assembly protein [Paenibacillus sp. 3LSP]|jgi:hypothetical protein|uniref:phage tail assembly protein n=1 Tax=Paenibacillus sp. 3LSP TaxID=2800795 RepID=UPI0028FD9860|nr:phage tail assembly protein [Paenibacillus sp. 3LSP]MDU0332539.1 phage tail assembly protein [Paenibacillus sp. 3LSP]